MDVSPAAGDDLLEVGRVNRSHGLRGEVLVDLTSGHAKRRQVGAIFTTNAGELVVSESRPHKNRWLMRFEGVVNRESADALRGTVLFAHPIDDEGVLWVHELIGAAVVDQDGVVRGTVVSVLDNPAADIMELDSGALVPVTFVVSGPADGTVEVAVPEGLFDL